MKIVVLGAGALGSLYGGYLAQAGNKVILIGRKNHLSAIDQRGLRVSGHDEFEVSLQTTNSARSVRSADVLLVCVRTIDTEQAMADVSHLQPEIVVSFQNGLYKDNSLIEHFGPGPVLGATSIVGARIVEPGHVRCTLFGHTWFGERDKHISPRAKGLMQVWRRSGLPVDIPEDIVVAEWSKLAYLLPVSALSGLTRLPYHQVLQSADLAYLVVQIVREVNAVAKAHGIELADYPNVNPRQLIETSFPKAIQLLRKRGEALEAGGQTDISTNMLHDIEIGRRTEIDAVAGDIVRLGQEVGLALPAISFAYRCILGIDSYTGRN